MIPFAAVDLDKKDIRSQNQAREVEQRRNLFLQFRRHDHVCVFVIQVCQKHQRLSHYLRKMKETQVKTTRSGARAGYFV